MAQFPMLSFPGAPTNGTNEVQRLTGGGTISGGTFDLTLDGIDALTAIPWNATAAQLQALVDPASPPAVAVTGGPIASTPFTFTFQNRLGGLNRADMTASATNLTGTVPTLTPSTVTPGVKGTYRMAGPRTILQDTTNGAIYYQTGTSETPVWGESPVAGSRTLTDASGTRAIESVF